MIVELLNSGKFDEALNALNNGEAFPTQLDSYQLQNITDEAFSKKQFEWIDRFINHKMIETDIYELEDFDKSIFKQVVRNAAETDDFINYFKNFISHFDNLNDEVKTQTLLGYFLENMAPLSTIKILIEAGCNPQFKYNSENSYLHLVSRKYYSSGQLSKEELNTLVKGYLSLLVDEGADINSENVVKETPLILAVKENKSHLIAHLLSLGANPNQVDKDGNNAFYYAVVNLRSLSLYQTLRDYGSADLNLINTKQVSILFEFLRMTNKPTEQDLALLKLLIEDGADLYQPSTYYNKEKTPLDCAVELPAEVLETIFSTDTVDINHQDDTGNTLLHKVCAFNVNFEAEIAKDTYKKVKFLLAAGADVNLTNDQDKKAIDLASDDNLKIKTVELLMKNQ